MERYEKYKPSGIEWIGEVPEHWESFRIKYALSRSAAGVWGDDEKGDSNDIICYRIADFDYNHGGLDLDDLTTRNIEPKQLEGRIVSKGDLLIEKSGGGEATPVGRVVKVNSDQRATYTNFIHSVTVKDGYSSNYLYYYFFNLYALKINMLFFNQTTGLQNLKVGDYLSQTIFLPSLAEQEAIAAYLDARCADIDKVVATQEKRIALLKELKQSVITQAVTRGLNPDVKMKDSGVEWIGEVPEHWEIRKIKACCKDEKYSIKTGPFGTQLKGEELKDDGPIRVYNQRNVIDDDFKTTSYYVSEEKANQLSGFYTKPSDLLITSRGTIGRSAIIPNNVPMGLLHPCLIAMRIDQNICRLEWLKLYINETNCFTTEVKINSNATTIDVIYTDTLKNIIVPIPSINEQEKILNYLDIRCAGIDKQIKYVTKQIELLREYKQSLITEVVTGKRKIVS